MSDRLETFNRRLDRHTLERLRREDAVALAFYRALEGAREELLGRLLAFEARWRGNASPSQTPSYLAAILDDIQRVLGALREDVIARLRPELEAGYMLGQEQTHREVTSFYDPWQGAFKPKVPTQAMLALLDGRTEFLDGWLRLVTTRVMQRVRESALIAIDDVRAVAAGREANEKAIAEALARGIAGGDGTRSIARKLMAPQDGEFVKMTFREAITTARLAINDAFNEGHAETLRDASALDPELEQVWCSCLVGSTRICLRLHGQVVPIGGEFRDGNWSAKRPPAIGVGAEPAFHLCRSRVCPHHPKWPPNPKLAPLSSERIAAYINRGPRPSSTPDRGATATRSDRLS